MNIKDVTVRVKVGKHWFSMIANSPAEAYETVSKIIDSQLYVRQADYRDKLKSEMMRTILNIFDGHTISHLGFVIEIHRNEEEEQK